MIHFQRHASTAARSKLLRKYPVGAVIHGYEVKRILDVPELKLLAIDLLHSQTGSNHLHIAREDKNNVFSIGFKTLPPDATGVPHILEHTTLCGSQKYPVRDPFFKMLNRSLANFMNAMTGHDYTFYPFSTTNKVDYYNLMNIYLDATMNPLLRTEDFYQEGWRLENTDIEDPSSDIVFKGVVYNEMKGQISNANYYFWNKFQESVYPSLNNSGGDPRKITDLHYPDLVEFHSKNYHPSNAKTFSYGSFPLETTLDRLNKEFLGFGKRRQDTKLLNPIDFENGKQIKVEGEIDPMLPADRQIKTSLTWIAGAPHDVYETFLLKVLESLLMDGHSSPFYQKLIESGIGLDFSINSGLESTTAINFLTVGVQSVKDIEQFKAAVTGVFKDLLQNPFDKTKVEAILQQLEIGKKDQKSDFGLQLLSSIIPTWINGVDPFEGLAFDDVLQKFREDFKEQGDDLFRNLIKKYIVGKPCFSFTVAGVEGFSTKLQQEEKSRLQSKLDRLNEDDRKAIHKRGLLLQDIQNATEDTSCLPSLSIKDIPRKGDYYDVKTSKDVSTRIADTNGITYVRAAKSLDAGLPAHLYPYLSLFANSLTSLGTSTETYGAIEDYIKLHTGGISMSFDATADPLTLQPKVSFRLEGCSLNNKTEHIFRVWKKLLVNTDFQKNKEKLKILVRSLASSNTSAVAESGHSFASGFADAYYSPTKAIVDTLGGIGNVEFISKMNSLLDNKTLFQKDLVDKLKEVQAHVANSIGLKFFVTTDSSDCANKVEQELSQFTKLLPDDVAGKKTNLLLPSDYPLLSQGLNCGWNPVLINFPFQVHYASTALPGVPYVNHDGAALQVMSNLLTFKHLHRQIREKGGAYGGGLSYNALEGMLTFYSYRDPNPITSLETFATSGEYVIDGAKWTKEDIEQAKLTIFQRVDAPTSPKSEGLTRFYTGVTDEMRQKRREQLLDVTLPDIQNVAEKYLVRKQGSRVVIGPPIPGETIEPKWNIKSL